MSSRPPGTTNTTDGTTRNGIVGKPILSPGVIGRKYSADGTGWFGPGRTPTQAAPPGSPVRVWEYQPGYNVAGQPRSSEGITFAQLRALANTYDLLRMVIETRKSQMTRMPWVIRPKPVPGETPQEALARSDDPRIAELTTFFRRPDRRRTWGRWLNALLEEILVTDAAAIYLKRSVAGTPFALQLIDGATIKPALDEQGEVVGYQQWAYGMPYHDLSRPTAAEEKAPVTTYGPDELFYLPRNTRTSRIYGFSPVEQIVVSVNLALRRQYQQLAFYTKGTIPEGFFEAPATWSPDQIESFQKKFDAYMSGNSDARAGMVMLPPGAKPIFPKLDVMKDATDDWLASLVCYAFSVSRSALIKQMNRASAEQGADEAVEEGLEPLMFSVAEIPNEVIEIGFGYDDLEFAWDSHREVDPVKQSEIEASDVKNGIRSIDEVREAKGLDPIGIGPGIITISGFVPFPKGGTEELLAQQDEDRQAKADALVAAASAPKMPMNGDGKQPPPQKGDAMKAAEGDLSKKKPFYGRP